MPNTFILIILIYEILSTRIKSQKEDSLCPSRNVCFANVLFGNCTQPDSCREFGTASDASAVLGRRFEHVQRTPPRTLDVRAMGGAWTMLEYPLGHSPLCYDLQENYDEFGKRVCLH